MIPGLEDISTQKLYLLILAISIVWALAFSILNYYRVRLLPQSYDRTGASIFTSLIYAPMLLLIIIGLLMQLLGVWDIPAILANL
jgi:hypothetical protein